jgi:hypothetical protein
MQQVVSFVERNPGLYMRAAAHHVNPCPVPEKAESYGYNTVHRAIDAGLVRCERDNRGVRLYPISVTLAEIKAFDREDAVRQSELLAAGAAAANPTK